ncbi:sensor histidine kinase [Microscilla marina]|uniref:Putative two-component system sensor protein n=1 Tax=Microscilla marina ATCC 23134 TaxID=313606 RepID=A1ZK57_MICM2|nr:sensor histidine kinase [Microscilla marina]EAY29083.1 putative two-component system sensor protein [Microscilla marina ATCC 23134]
MKNSLQHIRWLDQALFWLFVYLFILNDYFHDSSLAESWHWALLELTLHAAIVYIHYFILIPKLWQPKRYVGYGLSLAGVFVVFVSLLVYSGLGELLLIEVSVNNLTMMLLTTLLLVGFSCLYWYYKQWFVKTNEALLLKSRQLETELQLLKSQISPHFLFNTLNNIYSLCQQKHDNAALMVTRLADILRYLIYEGAQASVPLHKEVAMIDNYIQLQLLKKSTSQNIDLYTEGMDSQHQIAPLILINFVENSFKHSNFFNDANAWIEVSICVEAENKLVVEVNNSLARPALNKTKTSGIGLTNSKRQLELHYPQAHELKITQHNDSFQVNLYIQLDR